MYQGQRDCPPFHADAVKELMLLATQGVEFSFNNQMSKQLDGVAMGSPLGPGLGNMLKNVMKVDGSITPGVYFHYVDDTSVMFVELDCDCFHVNLNQLHPALRFMVEKEQNNSLQFLDVSVEKGGTECLSNRYRKPPFTGQSIH